jgi:AAA domain (dynein-related subfamily)
MTARATRKPAKPEPCDPAAAPEPFGTLRLNAERLKALPDRRDPTLLSGPTGCGKTTLIEWLVRHLGLPGHEVVIGSREMLPADLVGRWRLGAGGSDWRDNALTRAVVEGRLLASTRLVRSASVAGQRTLAIAPSLSRPHGRRRVSRLVPPCTTDAEAGVPAESGAQADGPFRKGGNG